MYVLSRKLGERVFATVHLPFRHAFFEMLGSAVLSSAVSTIKMAFRLTRGFRREIFKRDTSFWGFHILFAYSSLLYSLLLRLLMVVLLLRIVCI